MPNLPSKSDHCLVHFCVSKFSVASICIPCYQSRRGHLKRFLDPPHEFRSLSRSPLRQHVFRYIHLRKEIKMNAFSASPPAITRSPMSGPEQAMENIDQTAQATTSRPISQREEATGNSVETIVRASQAEQTSNDDSLMQTLDWPLPATRWIPRPRPAQATSNPSHRLCRVNKNGEWEIQQPWEHDHAHEPQLCLTQTSPLSAERPQLDYDEIQAPIVFELTVPALKYHEHLECITHPRLTQQEYERRVFAGE